MKKEYVIITPAHNEERNIERTIKSVTSQTILPKLWIIISDRSNDGTDNIIISYLKRHKYIKFVKISGKPLHSFGNKVHAINAGINIIKKKQISYNYIGILDADVAFDKDYFEKIIKKFEINKGLGLAGGNIVQFYNNKYVERIKSLNSVAGAVQLFRRECLEQIPGFIPREYGGEDSLVEICARMHGWQVCTFPEIRVVHFGNVGDAAGMKLRTRYRRGFSFYTLGYHLLFHLVRCLYRLVEKPYIIGSIMELYGFIHAAITYKKIDSPPEVVEYLRKEQLGRLKNLLKLKHGITNKKIIF